ncbi:MAG TPA: TonB-dependent receptor [Gemmatimonadales bacterium]|nr:TonB-dependent receptor [Gemmatimonadales bacterium]
MPTPKNTGALVPALLLIPALLAAQQPATSDTTRKDSTAVALPELSVTVTRTPEPLRRVPAPVSVLDSTAIQRGRPTVGLSESLNNIPGVYIGNRYNFSLDERVSIRGAGARANFGTRGVKILLDGVPLTMPDGQSTLINLDLSDVRRTEVLRGSAASLYGNASGGVVSLSSERVGDPLAATARGEGGSFGMYKAGVRLSGQTGTASGGLTVSHLSVDGFRQHSASDLTQVNFGGNWVTSAHGSLEAHIRYADQPKAQNPGALTYAEWQANPDSAAANNIRRNADKDVSQGMASLGYKYLTDGGNTYQATIFGVTRTLRNPLAAPPPDGLGPTAGTYVAIDRAAGGLRLSGINLLEHDGAAKLTYGLDLQRMRDNRTNARSVSGVPDTLILDQTEKVTEFGPFAQLSWDFVPKVSALVALRYDWVAFDVADHHLSDGVDNSGSITMHAPSASVGFSYDAAELLVPYVNVSTSFDTPTTTELVNQPNTTGGFNTSLKPQKAVTYEVGARGRRGRFGYSLAIYDIEYRDAITQYSEVGGRAYYTNAGKSRNEGFEIGADVTPIDGVKLFGSYTYADYTFTEYRLVNGATTDTLDGNRVAGVPKFFLRLGLRAQILRDGWADIDQTFAGSYFADDANTLLVDGAGGSTPGMPPGIGGGITAVRVGWNFHPSSMIIAPFIGVDNLFDKNYISAVTVNGAAGRVYEPGASRTIYAGAEIGWAKERR